MYQELLMCPWHLFLFWSPLFQSLELQAAHHQKGTDTTRESNNLLGGIKVQNQ